MGVSLGSLDDRSVHVERDDDRGCLSTPPFQNTEAV
jgi:hypothetical protein